MLIIIQKKSESNQWDYPENPRNFPNGFSNPDNKQELVVENNSGKTLEELSANVPYEVVEYDDGMSEFTTANESVTINGNATQGFQSVYFGVSGDSIDMSFDIVDGEGTLQTQLDSIALNYPPILALPIVKIAVNIIVDEVYFSTTLVEGVITVTGSFPASGNWRMSTERINAALAEIGANWTINKEDVTFRINS